MKDIAFPSCEECEIQSGFFCAFSKGLKKEIGQDKRHLKIKKGENLFTQGSHSIGLYCLYKGNATHVDEVIEHSDIIQIGAKAMYDQGILRACAKINKPVLLKRRFGSTLQEFVQ